MLRVGDSVFLFLVFSLSLQTGFAAEADTSREESFSVEEITSTRSSGTSDRAAKARSRQYYAFFAPGARPSDGTGIYAFGGGAEWFVVQDFALGLDASVMGFIGCSSCGAFIGSVNASYHFRNLGSRKLAPFVLAGVGSAVTGEGGIATFIAGAGLNYWVNNGVALRLEVRNDYTTSDEESYLTIRVGVTF